MKSEEVNANKIPQDFFETGGKTGLEVDDILNAQDSYHKSYKGKRALKRARDKYDRADPARRRKQKREYMRRIREKNPDAWRH